MKAGLTLTMYLDFAAHSSVGMYVVATRTFSAGRWNSLYPSSSISCSGRIGTTTTVCIAIEYSTYSPVRLTAIATVKSKRGNMIFWLSVVSRQCSDNGVGGNELGYMLVLRKTDN